MKASIAEVSIVKSEEMRSLVVVTDFNVFSSTSCGDCCGFCVGVEDRVPGKPELASEGMNRGQAFANSMGSFRGIGFGIGVDVQASQYAPFFAD